MGRDKWIKAEINEIELTKFNQFNQYELNNQDSGR